MHYELLTKKHQYDYKEQELPLLTPALSLTTDEERAYLYWLIKNGTEQRGAIVEIGTWYGSSAGYIVAGLRDSHSSQTFYAIDRFVCRHSDATKAAEQNIVLSCAPNSDTLPLVQQHLEPIYPRIKLIKSEIDQIAWPQHVPVELIHLDAPKRLRELLHVLKTFAPVLTPGVSVVVAQDFLMPRAYALPLIFYALRNALELAHIPTAHGTMATFSVRQTIALNTVNTDLSTWSDAEVRQAFSYWQEFPFSDEQKEMFDLGLTYYFLDHRRGELAV